MAEEVKYQVKLIGHSGFLMEFPSCLLLFDYYQGEIGPLPPEKKLYVFVSHGHQDHYSRYIWDLQDHKAGVSYIVDQETAKVYRSHIPEKAELWEAGPHQQIKLDQLCIDTFRSTDQGLAFLVNIEGSCVFHAGDLNIWHWDGEPEEENRLQKQIFEEEMLLLKEKLENYSIPPKLLFACIPLDPRLGLHLTDGLLSLLTFIIPEYIFPMHDWGRREEVKEALRDPRLVPYADQIRFATEPFRCREV